jgi:hypothetical protein
MTFQEKISLDGCSIYYNNSLPITVMSCRWPTETTANMDDRRLQHRGWQSRTFWLAYYRIDPCTGSNLLLLVQFWWQHFTYKLFDLSHANLRKYHQLEMHFWVTTLQVMVCIRFILNYAKFFYEHEQCFVQWCLVLHYLHLVLRVVWSPAFRQSAITNCRFFSMFQNISSDLIRNLFLGCQQSWVVIMNQQLK